MKQFISEMWYVVKTTPDLREKGIVISLFSIFAFITVILGILGVEHIYTMIPVIIGILILWYPIIKSKFKK